ncbi:MAG: hypothetical protein M1839_005009 [Geoglossum umbratile]|nr:MAG: hypothetical protein M1839_005009 [Geoglossum umbratile]
MAAILGIPNELLLFIYEDLGDLDDALHLARCCRQLYSLFESGTNRIRIMRSIIVNSAVHKYDIRLCHFIDTNQSYSVNYELSGDLPRNCWPDSSVFTKCWEASEDDLTDDHIWSIVCRWQALRLLQDLYLHPFIRPAYLQSVFPFEQGSNFTGLVDRLAREGPISIPEPRSCSGVAAQATPPESFRFDSRQTQRFYQALTAHWLAIESLRLAGMSDYKTQALQNKRYDLVHSIWGKNSERTLRESCDVLEVYGFVQGYLVRKIFADVDTFPQWVLGEGFMDPQERLKDNWDFFIKTARLCLRPSDIIELFLGATWRTSANGASYPPNKIEYLRYRGFFELGGVVEIRDTWQTPDLWFSVGHLETDVELKIMEVDKSLANVWPDYRDEWVSEGTPTVLWQAKSDEDIVDRIRDFRGRWSHSTTSSEIPPPAST